MDHGNEKIAEAFDNPRRSQMIWQLARIRALDLLENGELENFSDQTREKVEFLASGPRR